MIFEKSLRRYAYVMYPTKLFQSLVQIDLERFCLKVFPLQSVFVLYEDIYDNILTVNEICPFLGKQPPKRLYGRQARYEKDE